MFLALTSCLFDFTDLLFCRSLKFYIRCPAGQQDETLCKNYISEIKDLRVSIEDCEARTVARIRKPMEKEPLKECVQKTVDQQVR